MYTYSQIGRLFPVAGRLFPGAVHIDNSTVRLYNIPMEKNMRSQMAESIRGFRLPRYAEIPTVGLYLEQTIKYINSYLAPLGCMELTGSMVSNYVKKGLIPSPVRKQYFPEQISYLFFVAVAKNLMSMENIDLLISVQRSSYTLSVAYDYMCRELENQLFYQFGLQDTLEDIGITESEEKNLLRGLISSAANVIYLHNYFEQLRRERME
jgi:hypothetical protein